MRSSLYVPGNHEKRTLQVFHWGADAVIFDLEDAVPRHQKHDARQLVKRRIAEKPPGNCMTFVRINGLHTGEALADLQAVVQQGLDGVVVPKVESTRDVHIVDWLLEQLERERNLMLQGITITPIIETPQGLMRLQDIAGSVKRLHTVALGLGDLTARTGMAWSGQNPALLGLKAQVVLASAAAGLAPPMDTVFADVNDDEGFIEAARLGRMIGCQGKTCIHPRQVKLANRIFAPDAKEVQEAANIVRAFAQQEQGGTASFTMDGQFVDYAVVEKAKRVLELAESWGLAKSGESINTENTEGLK
jgi:citrate lyase subunit beta/citryl-CoA lyase